MKFRSHFAGILLAIGSLDAAPVYDIVVASGNAVPGAGTDPRIEAGSVWTKLGTPAIAESGEVAFLASWKGPTETGSGIFLNNELIAKTGETIPQIAGAVFKSFKDPVIGQNEQMAFIATISGGDVNALNDTLVVAGPSVDVVARENDLAPSSTGARFASFQSVAIPANGAVWFAANLRHGRGVSALSDRGLWLRGVNGLQLIVREGSLLPLPWFTEPVKNFRALDVVPGSEGQGRCGDGFAALQVTFADRSQGIFNIRGNDGDFENDVSTGFPLFTGGPIARKFGMPSWLSDGSFAVFAILESESPKSPTKDAIVISREGSTSILAEVGQATNLGEGISFTSFGDPVMADDRASFAFVSKISGRGVNGSNNTVAWWSPDQAAGLMAIARTGNQAVECPEGCRWNRFLSIALPGGNKGPLLLATLAKGHGGVNASNDCGLWGIDSEGALRLLLREGDQIGNKPVRSFNVLQAVAGSAGVTRSFNSIGQVVMLATYTDGSTSIVRISIP